MTATLPAPRPRGLPPLLPSVLQWLLDDPAARPRARRALSAATFAAFVALVCLGAATHDVWRDEARALTIALEPESWLGLRTALQNEGHPAAWHLLLRAAHAVAPTPLVLPIVSALVGVAAAALVFFAAPLPTWWRVGFLAGWVPLFSGSILCRNYGIAMLLLFAFCALLARARPRPLSAALALAALANTNVYGTMMAACFGVVLAIELRRAGTRAWVLAAAAAVIAAGIAAGVWTMLPTADSKVLASTAATLGDLGSGLPAGIARFHANAGPLFGLALLAWPFVLLTIAATACVPHVAIAVAAFFAGAAWLMQRVYSAGPHHLGMLFVVLVAATWLRAAAGGRGCSRRRAAGLHRAAWTLLLFCAWPALLALHAYRGVRTLKIEVESTNSSAPELAALLDRPELQGAVLVGEPDYHLDALPWYRDNLLYVWREGRFARRVSWTTANGRSGDLEGLLASARGLRRQGHGPILLVIGHPIALDAAGGDVAHGYGDRFRWTPAQRREFAAATELVASLPADPSRFRGDERYDVYRLRD